MAEQTMKQLPEGSQNELPVLSILRWTIGILCFLYFLGMLRAVITPDKTPENYLNLLLWPFTVLLVGYVFVPGFRLRLRRWFMPLLLGAIAVVPIVAVYGANWLAWRGQPAGTADFLHVGQLFVWIAIALLLVSTHYGVRAILIFVGGTSILAIVLAVWQRQVLAIELGPALQGVAGWLTVFLFVGYYVSQLTKSIRQQQLALAAQNAQLANYAHTVEQLAVTQERNRLARELHDTLAHTLSAVEIQLKALDVLIQRNPAAAQQHLAETRALTREGLQAARRTLHDLRVQPVAELGLLPALARLAGQTAQRAGAEPIVSLPPQLAGVPAPVEHHLYRIAEEALNNVVRHAQAKRFWLALTDNASQLELVIHDDGLGFDPTTLPAGRLGLSGMRERANLIQASFAVTSVPGKGSRVTATWERT